MQALRGAYHVAGGVKQVEHCLVGGEAGRVARGDVPGAAGSRHVCHATAKRSCGCSSSEILRLQMWVKQVSSQSRARTWASGPRQALGTGPGMLSGSTAAPVQASPDRVRNLPQQGVCIWPPAQLTHGNKPCWVLLGPGAPPAQGHNKYTHRQVQGAAIGVTLMTQSLPAVMMTCLFAWWARASTSLPLWATHWYTRCGWEAGRLRMSHTHRRPSNPAGGDAVFHIRLWYDIKGVYCQAP